jgi:hypothetical protein
LVRIAHEPFVAAWHRQDVKAKLTQHGFQLKSDSDSLPIRQIWAYKPASADGLQ